MSREMPVPPEDLMELDHALAVVFMHDQQGQPWVIGAEQVVLDRAKRTVRYYAARTLWKGTRPAVLRKEFNGGDIPSI